MGTANGVLHLSAPRHLSAGTSLGIAVPAGTGRRAAHAFAGGATPPRPIGPVLQVCEIHPRADGGPLCGGSASLRAAAAIVPMIGHAGAPALPAPSVHGREAGLVGRHGRYAESGSRGRGDNQTQCNSQPHLPVPVFACRPCEAWFRHTRAKHDFAITPRTLTDSNAGLDSRLPGKQRKNSGERQTSHTQTRRIGCYRGRIAWIRTAAPRRRACRRRRAP
jgi:hypothetical protein